MEVSKLKKLIKDCFTTIYFKYNGEWGNVEPCTNGKKEYSYLCYYKAFFRQSQTVFDFY